MSAAGGTAVAPGRRIGVIVTILGLLVLVMVVASSMRQGSVSCEVCITFKGRSLCRTASATGEDEARRTAADNACALISSGMADGIACSNTPPDSVTCTP